MPKPDLVLIARPRCLMEWAMAGRSGCCADE